MASLSCDASFTCGCSFSFEDSQQKRTFLLFPWPHVPLSWLELPIDELKILPSATREEEEPLKTAGPLLEELTSLPTLDRGWLLPTCVHPPLRIPAELPREESLEPDLKVFGDAGSAEPPRTILWSLLGSFEPRLTACGDEGSAEPLLKDLR